MYFTNTKYVLLHNLFVVGCIFYCCSLFCWIYSIWLWRTFIYPNKRFISRNHTSPIKSFLIFMLSLLMYVQFIQLVSLVLKDEIITWFTVIVILLVSCFVITGWNPFSYILSFNIDFYYEKTFILFFINLLIPFYKLCLYRKYGF